MAKSIDLFKKVGDNKGIFYEKIGTINNKNSMNLTEAEEIKKKWQEQGVINKQIKLKKDMMLKVPTNQIVKLQQLDIAHNKTKQTSRHLER